QLDPADLQVPDCAYLLPPGLVERLVDASRVTDVRSWLDSPVFADERYRKLAVNLVCHAYALGWSRPALLALADWIESHPSGTPGDSRDLIDYAVWLVDGGSSIWQTVQDRAPSKPNLSVEDADKYLLT